MTGIFILLSCTESDCIQVKVTADIHSYRGYRKYPVLLFHSLPLMESIRYYCISLGADLLVRSFTLTQLGVPFTVVTAALPVLIRSHPAQVPILLFYITAYYYLWEFAMPMCFYPFFHKIVYTHRRAFNVLNIYEARG